MNDLLDIKINYDLTDGTVNYDDLYISGIIIYNNEIKSTIILDYIEFSIKIWNYFSNINSGI